MRLKIWHKILLGISIPSFIVLLGGLLTIVYINDVEKRAGYEVITDDLQNQVLEVRRNEKNYFRFKNTEHLNELHNAILVLNKSVTTISPETVYEIGNKDFSLLLDALKTYPEQINVLFENYEKAKDIIEKVRAEGRKLELFATNKPHAEELSISFILNLRRLEKNYMLFLDNKSFNELNSGLLQVKNLTPICYKCDPYIKSINTLFDAYEESNIIQLRILSIGDRLEKLTGIMVTHERARIKAFFSKTRRILYTALVLLCLLGPLLVYKTAGRIVLPIKRLSKITREIADGNLELRAPIREHDETAELSKSFNTMLDYLQITHQSLEESMVLLNEKQAQLVESEKRASLGLLVSGVAHELNNPLNNISLITERMVEEKDELSKDEMRDYNNILVQCERAKHIVDSLLDFARARKSTVMEKQDIVKVLKESFNLVRNQLNINKIELIQEIPDDPIFINGNRSKLEQIFVSIFTNAIQAIHDNGILSVSLKPGTDDKNVLIKISDTGPGIPEEDIKNVFEPFFTTKPVGKGTGLGLSVCRSLVMEHNGEVDVESELSKGTTFTVKLPLYEESA